MVFNECVQYLLLTCFSQTSETITNSTLAHVYLELTPLKAIKTTRKFVGAKLGVHSVNGDTTVAECSKAGKALFPENLKIRLLTLK